MKSLLVVIAFLLTCVAALAMAGPGNNEKEKCPVVEYGTVAVKLSGSNGGRSTIRFHATLNKPPIVLASECFSKGTFMVVKAEDVTPQGCTIAVSTLKGDTIDYEAQIAFVVLDPHGSTRHDFR